MNKIKNYALISSDNKSGLILKIQDLLFKNPKWVPYGSLSVTVVNDEFREYTQPFVIYS